MIYDLSLRTAGLCAGIFLVLVSLPGLLQPGGTKAVLVKLPRSRVLGIFLLTAAFVWSFWLLATMEMGEFSSFRRPLMFGLPVGYVLVMRFVGEFLAVRALGILALLAGEPLLEAAFLRYETSRLYVTVLAYLLIVAGLFWVTVPYVLRDQISWTTRSNARWIALHAVGFFYGAVILALALTRY